MLEDCIAAVEAATARRDRLEAHIEAALPDWSLAPVVRALQALRGMALVAAATVIAELGDITRFANPRQLMAYLGLVPSEHSSGRASNPQLVFLKSSKYEEDRKKMFKWLVIALLKRTFGGQPEDVVDGGMR